MRVYPLASMPSANLVSPVVIPPAPCSHASRGSALNRLLRTACRLPLRGHNWPKPSKFCHASHAHQPHFPDPIQLHLRQKPEFWPRNVGPQETWTQFLSRTSGLQPFLEPTLAPAQQHRPTYSPRTRSRVHPRCAPTLRPAPRNGHSDDTQLNKALDFSVALLARFFVSLVPRVSAP